MIATAMDPAALTTILKSTARELGFALAGVAPAATPTGLTHFREWLERGYDGQMHYLRKRAPAYEHPRHLLDGVRSILMLALPYRTEAPRAPESGQGRVSRYAWNSTDYHDVIHDRLRRISARLQECVPEARSRGVVDTAPLLERDLAQRAGLGWIAKNTMLINRGLGSWFFLAAWLTDQELEYDLPDGHDHCGTCRACLDACPTQAFPAPYVLDARRCISYLTIELRESVPLDLRAVMGDWIFGCDICQEVCPWNRKGADGDQELFGPVASLNPVDLAAFFTMTEDDFRGRFRNTPLWRTKRRGLLRNAALALGNQRAPQAIPALALALVDCEPQVRAAGAWALGQIGGEAAKGHLVAQLALESDVEVRRELHLALNASDSASAP